MKKGTNVLITTDKRGVFAGKLKSYDEKNKVAVLKKARMCVYWPKECKGVLGLASVGPLKGSRISQAVEKIRLEAVTAVVEMTAEAAALWESEPWS